MGVKLVVKRDSAQQCMLDVVKGNICDKIKKYL